MTNNRHNNTSNDAGTVIAMAENSSTPLINQDLSMRRQQSNIICGYAATPGISALHLLSKTAG